jgi:hypothetical protein
VSLCPVAARLDGLGQPEESVPSRTCPSSREYPLPKSVRRACFGAGSRDRLRLCRFFGGSLASPTARTPSRWVVLADYRGGAPRHSLPFGCRASVTPRVPLCGPAGDHGKLRDQRRVGIAGSRPAHFASTRHQSPSSCCPSGCHWSRTAPRAMRAFVIRRARGVGSDRARSAATAMRMFITFLVSPGRCPVTLVGAVPMFMSWRLRSFLGTGGRRDRLLLELYKLEQLNQRAVLLTRSEGSAIA